jgi:hypothetical protein
MVTKSRTQKTGNKKARVKVGRLELNKETVKDLGRKERKEIKGGVLAMTYPNCPTPRCTMAIC